MMDYLGLIVAERPFDIHVVLTNFTEYTVDFEIINNNSKQSKSLLIKPVKPVYYKCNETYQYGDLDYGAKCSCKVSLY